VTDAKSILDTAPDQPAAEAPLVQRIFISVYGFLRLSVNKISTSFCAFTVALPQHVVELKKSACLTD